MGTTLKAWPMTAEKRLKCLGDPDRLDAAFHGAPEDQVAWVHQAKSWVPRLEALVKWGVLERLLRDGERSYWAPPDTVRAWSEEPVKLDPQLPLVATGANGLRLADVARSAVRRGEGIALVVFEDW